MKLQSTTDFLLHLRGMTTSEICKAYPRRFREPVWKGSEDEMVKDILALDAAKWDVVGEYAKLMKQPLTLGMFMPCDKEGNVMEKPKISCATCDKCTCSTEYIKIYDQAKDQVLFKTEIDLSTAKFHISQKRTVEYFTAFEIEVTNSFIKKLGL